MADSSEQSEQTLLFIKVVDVVNYVTSKSKKKQNLFKNAIDIQNGLLKILLD